MFMLSKRTLFIICGLCIPFVMHAQRPGEIVEQDPEMIELEKERIRLELEANKARMQMEQNRIKEELQISRYFGCKDFTPAVAQAGDQQLLLIIYQFQPAMCWAPETTLW